jgi:hypothetical protein
MDADCKSQVWSLCDKDSIVTVVLTKEKEEKKYVVLKIYIIWL